MNEERDVLLVVTGGSGFVRIDAVNHSLKAGQGIMVEKGARFETVSGDAGLRYLSIHTLRPPLQVAPLK